MTQKCKYSFALIIIIVLACSGSDDDTFDDSGGNQQSQFILVNAFPNISFDRPLDIQNAGDGTDRLFVVEQRGIIHVFENDPFVTDSSIFLDIRGSVFFDGSQRGMLGMAFHPDYEINGFFYVFYLAQNPNRTIISRFKARGDNPNQADASSEFILLEIIHPGVLVDPDAFHGGGRIAFGPDGLLYIALGDAGPGGDASSNGQNTSTLFGSILRIDVDNPEGDLNYGIPPDNPFASNNNGDREEIFAYGFRNPFRFSFDFLTGLLWLGDVGEFTFEEVNIINNGGNYGWDIMEGTDCHDPPMLCDRSGLLLPVLAYSRNLGGSVIGGHVYRGSTIPELVGSFIYGDFLSGIVWALLFNGIDPTVNTEILRFDPFSLVSFGIDENNEIFVCSLDGSIYTLIRDIA
ncbi:PQQ-dependent sugar dehydrogenase [Desulfobacterota bacterium AH_259_B03_O07]|nr:PQQ-dependent sugar dehydrogenase [Desulfobacterota bacterium AH_259_B03_O07]